MKKYDVIKEKYSISCDKNYCAYFRDDHITIVDKFLKKGRDIHKQKGRGSIIQKIMYSIQVKNFIFKKIQVCNI